MYKRKGPPAKREEEEVMAGDHFYTSPKINGAQFRVDKHQRAFDKN
jgi:hypothetical protein